MIPRHLAATLRSAVKDYPVVTLTGPRQSGKTTLVRSALPRHEYMSLEDPDQRSFALEDPRGFLGQFNGNVILDEVQRAPDLFSYIQGIVDQHDRSGQFILTGSQNFLLMQKISQSLAGRCAVLHLLPFSYPELIRRKSAKPKTIGHNTRRQRGPEDNPFEVLFTGSYPRIHAKKIDPQQWLSNYYRTYLERDVRDVLHVGDLESFGRFVRLCAGRSGQLLNLASLAGDCGISHPTARRWLSVLEAGFLVYLLRPHHRNFNKRLVKSPKLYFLDTGLLCYLLHIRSARDLCIHSSRGAVFESWIISEILKNYYHRGAEPDIYFWRDSAGHEIDLLVDHGDQTTPIEIKSGQTVNNDFFKGLEYWRGLPGQGECSAALVYGGDTSYTRKRIAVTSWQHWT